MFATYKIESNSCRDEFGLLSKELIDEVQEWNQDVRYYQKIQRNFWVGIFYPNVYDEFETIDFFDDKTLRKCIKYLYHVNADSDIVTEGEAIMDAPINQLYGIRLKDDQEQFVWLGLDSGTLKKLDDSSTDLIFEKFGDKWYMVK